MGDSLAIAASRHILVCCEKLVAILSLSLADLNHLKDK